MSLGAIPVLNQVMIATRGATDAFSGVQRHVNNSVCVSSIHFSITCTCYDRSNFLMSFCPYPSRI